MTKNTLKVKNTTRLKYCLKKLKTAIKMHLKAKLIQKLNK